MPSRWPTKSPVGRGEGVLVTRLTGAASRPLPGDGKVELIAAKLDITSTKVDAEAVFVARSFAQGLSWGNRRRTRRETSSRELAGTPCAHPKTR